MLSWKVWSTEKPTFLPQDASSKMYQAGLLTRKTYDKTKSKVQNAI